MASSLQFLHHSIYIFLAIGLVRVASGKGYREQDREGGVRPRGAELVPRQIRVECWTERAVPDGQCGDMFICTLSLLFSDSRVLFIIIIIIF